MAQRLCAIFASASVCMLDSFVPRTMHRALPTAVSGVSSVVVLLVARTLGRARCGRRRRRGRPWVAQRHSWMAPRRLRGPSSAFGFGGVRSVGYDFLTIDISCHLIMGSHH